MPAFLKLIAFTPLVVFTALCFTTTHPGSAQAQAINQEVWEGLDSDVQQVPSLTSVQAFATQPMLRQGTQISLNGRTWPAAWSQWQQAAEGAIRTGISDAGVTQLLGVELLSTGDLTQQPVRWFSQLAPLTPQLAGSYRYLDMSDFAQAAGWQMQVIGNTLSISSPAATVQAIEATMQNWGEKEAVVSLPRSIVIELDRPTPWQANFSATLTPPEPAPVKPPNTPKPQTPPAEGAGNNRQQEAADDTSKPQGETPEVQKPKPPKLDEWVITVDGQIDPALVQRLNALEPGEIAYPGYQLPDAKDKPVIPPKARRLKVETAANQTTVRLLVPPGWRPLVVTSPNTNRLQIDIQPDSLVEKDILWAPGVRWHQQYLTLGQDRFPVVWLEIDLRQSGLSLKPIWSEPATQVGTAPLIATANRWQASAAINGGFFNRNNTMPLGALRRDNQWLSSPILNRGAMAWNDSGSVKMGRLALKETLIAAAGVSLPVLYLNSAFVQQGISRYSPEWGLTYTALSDGETIVTVENNRVTGQQPAGEVGKTAFPIPRNGYLLVLRKAATDALATGTSVAIESVTAPADFSDYPHIIGAGPLLMQNGQIVLDAKAEGFSDAFIQQTASRSAIGTTATGTLLIAAVHNRAGGAGSTLAELAQLMRQLGAVEALNLDGGSSTGLYLGGQLLDRPARTAARVHNGLGVFLDRPR
ncbi:phosphodiester glycosidase family protein [Microcoleus sp. FACHB-68]|uniref:phosphodiester glycosidase family protein n=1 Tax=Microcoleus sp. FACHB-68 TaxID=2692826 RepID=UPI001F55955B|nr:phosphodiester glycosidase family protein [Microcoleus sp. FACHB-68]